jgi:hypothetical protein
MVEQVCLVTVHMQLRQSVFLASNVVAPASTVELLKLSQSDCKAGSCRQVQQAGLQRRTLSPSMAKIDNTVL